MKNILRTYGSRVNPVEASRIANRNIEKLNEDGWVAKQFSVYSRFRTMQGNEIEYHFISVLYEK